MQMRWLLLMRLMLLRSRYDARGMGRHQGPLSLSIGEQPTSDDPNMRTVDDAVSSTSDLKRDLSVKTLEKRTFLRNGPKTIVGIPIPSRAMVCLTEGACRKA